MMVTTAMKMAATYMDSNDPSPPSGETPNSRSMKSICPPMLPAWYLIHDFVQVNNAGRCAIVSRAHHLAIRIYSSIFIDAG
jgi:hypothetical protein